MINPGRFVCFLLRYLGAGCFWSRWWYLLGFFSFLALSSFSGVACALHVRVGVDCWVVGFLDRFKTWWHFGCHPRKWCWF